MRAAQQDREASGETKAPRVNEVSTGSAAHQVAEINLTKAKINYSLNNQWLPSLAGNN